MHIRSFYIREFWSGRDYKGAKGERRVFVWVREWGGAEKKGRLRHILALDFPAQWEIGSQGILLVTCAQLMLSSTLLPHLYSQWKCGFIEAKFSWRTRRVQHMDDRTLSEENVSRYSTLHREPRVERKSCAKECLPIPYMATLDTFPPQVRYFH